MPDPIVMMPLSERDLSLLRMACRLARAGVTDVRTLSRLYRLQQRCHRALGETGLATEEAQREDREP